MAQTILIIGKNFERLTSYLINHDYEYLALLDASRNFKHDDRSIDCDFSDTSVMLQTVDTLTKKHKIDGIFALYENYILPAAVIAEHLGLPYLSTKAAAACTDKELMRKAFSGAPEPISPDFKVVDNVSELQEFAASHEFPLILKPASLAKSLLVTKNHDLTELLENYETTISQIDEVYKRYAPLRTPKVLVEEFLEGSIHSVDAFIGSNGEPQVLEQVVDYQTGYDIGYDDNFHYSRLLPSKLSKDVIADVRRVAALGCKSLGIKNSPAHVEIILTKKGPKIVEIGARNGGYRERMHGLANEIDITGNAVNLALGKPVNIETRRNDNCAVLELFPKISGTFSGISRHQELMKLSSLAYFSLKVKPGDTVGKAAQGHKMCAVIMLHNKDAQQFEHDLNFVNRHVYVVTS